MWRSTGRSAGDPRTGRRAFSTTPSRRFRKHGAESRPLRSDGARLVPGVLAVRAVARGRFRDCGTLGRPTITVALDGGHCTKPFRDRLCPFAEVHGRATVRDDLATDAPRVTDAMADFGTHPRNDPAASPGVCATASAQSDSLGSDAPATALRPAAADCERLHRRAAPG
jgi:hypothetical protein